MLTTKKTDVSDIIKQLDNQLNRKDLDTPLPKTKSLIHILSGSKGRGKTTLAMNILKNKNGYKKYFDNIYLFSPTAKGDPKMKKLIEELDKDDHYFEEFNDQNMHNVFERIKESNEEIKADDKEPHNLIIFDDCMASLPKSIERSSLNKLIPNARHHNTYLMFLVQRYVGVSPLIRSQADLISFFRTDNTKELLGLIDDINIDKNKMIMLYEFATEKPNDFLHINLLTRKFYKNFDEIII